MAESTLERRYRRLLVAYPPAYRAERGDELLGTLLDVAPPGRRWPVPVDAIDLVASGLRRRLDLSALRGLDGGLVLAAPMALALAAGIAGFAWWRVEPVAAGVYSGATPLFGVFRTVGPIGYAVWLLAALGWAVLRPHWSRVLIGGAIMTTMALPVMARLSRVDRPPLWVILALVTFGLLALAGSAPAVGGTRRGPLDARWAVPIGALAVAAGASAVVEVWTPTGDAFGYYYQPTIARVGTVVTAAVAAMATIAITGQLRSTPRRPDSRAPIEWLWATALLGLPAGWVGPFDTGPLRLAAEGTEPHFGRLAQILLASCVAVATLGWLARLARDRRPTPRSTDPRSTDPRSTDPRSTVEFVSQRPIAAAVLGSGLGLTLFVAVALGSRGLPIHVVVGLAAVLVVGVLGRPRPFRAALPWLLAGFVAAWLVAVYDNGWHLTGWTDPPHTASLVVTLVLLPLAASTYAAARALLGRTASAPVRRALAAVIVLVVSVGWIGYATVPYVLSWGPVLGVLGACWVAIALARHDPTPRSDFRGSSEI